MKLIGMFGVLCLAATQLFAQFEGTERFLVPLYVEDPLPGAFGSEWITEFSVVNDSDGPVNIYGWDQQCQVLCATEPAPPHVAFYPSLAFWATGVQGIYIQVPSESAEDVSLHLRVRDRSRSAISWGAEVPVIHESRARSVVRLLDIPTDPRYRQHVRVYDLEPSEGSHAILRAYGVNEATTNPINGNVPAADPLLFETQLPFSLPFGGMGTGGHPGFAELFLTGRFDFRGFDRIRITLESTTASSRLWAFASVTNDETQQVSIISPE